MTDAIPSRVRPWRPIEPLPEELRNTNGRLSGIEALRVEWARFLDELSEDERVAIRQRSLRRLAIETGIIERLYDIDWGLTLTLVAEGFSRDVIERAGGRIEPKTLETLKAQRDSLALVQDFVRDERRLGPGFIKELHAALTRTQGTFETVDRFGQLVERPLQHGAWKAQPNSVTRPDGTKLEFAPPEHVATEIENLIAIWEALDAQPVHPVITAAWFHHRFVQIHPFEDGNGRVARALTLLVLERHHLAPLVIDRFHRDAYLRALDRANDGSLDELIALFARLETAALTNELERPVEPEEVGASADVARTLVGQLKALRATGETKREKGLRTRAITTFAHVERWFKDKQAELSTLFASQGLADATVRENSCANDGEYRNWWYRSIVESAKVTGHFADFSHFKAWSSLRVSVEGMLVRYVASIHGAGRSAGVVAVTTFAEILPDPRVAPSAADAVPGEFIQTASHAFTIVWTERTDDVEARMSQLDALLDEGLAAALAELMRRV